MVKMYLVDLYLLWLMWMAILVLLAYSGVQPYSLNELIQIGTHLGGALLLVYLKYRF